MLEALSTLLNFILEFNWRHVITIFLACLIFLGGLVIFEYETKYFSFNRLERTVFLLNKLKDLEKSKEIKENDKFMSVYNDVLNKLNNIEKNNISIQFPDSDFLKFLAGAFPWLIFTFAYAPDLNKNKARAFPGIIAAIIFGCLLGGINVFLPNLYWPIGNLIVFPFVAFFVTTIAIGLFMEKRNKG